MEKVIDIKISDIDDFPDHPFKVIENEDMFNMRDSIKENGVLVPALRYLKDKDGLKFTIGNDTHYSYTTYGALITVTYKNTPIKGQLEIKKTGENLVIKEINIMKVKVFICALTFLHIKEEILMKRKNYKI